MSTKCTDTQTQNAVTLDTKARPCPWSLADSCTHEVDVDNQRPISLHNVEIYAEAVHKLVELQDPKTKVLAHSVLVPVPGVISSTAKHREQLGLKAPAASADNTEEIETTTSFHYATRKNGRRDKRKTIYELEITK
jgi:hypothetical protein